MSDPFHNHLMRLDKLRLGFVHLMKANAELRERLRKRDQPLIDKVRRLEDEKENLQALWDANVRVIRKEIEEQVRNENKLTAEEVEVKV